MKNLENYGVLDLNTSEFKTINGGYTEEDWNTPSQNTVWLGTVSSKSFAEQYGFNFGYFCGRLLKNAVEGMLPW